MSNLTTFSYFILGAYLNVGKLQYFYFTITALLYFVIFFLNTSPIVFICVNRSLHEPMYMFLCSLFVNELYGSTGLFPFLLIQILSDVHTISVPLCFLQSFCVHTYGSIEISNLAVMSYDRYLAICSPLHYKTKMTSNNTAVLITVVWLYCFAKIIIHISLNLRLTPCGNVLNTLYCHNYPVVKLACSDTKVNNIYGVFDIFLLLVVPLLLVLFSYTRIMKVCFSGSKEARQKSVSTCTPQVVSLLNFSFGSGFEMLQSRFDMTSLPSALRLFLSLYFLMMQPILNPIVYGIQMSKIRNVYKHVLCSKISSAVVVAQVAAVVVAQVAAVVVAQVAAVVVAQVAAVVVAQVAAVVVAQVVVEVLTQAAAVVVAQIAEMLAQAAAGVVARLAVAHPGMYCLYWFTIASHCFPSVPP
ncbi:olfactory receptor 142-like [Archocentrus centrarchus]|uniref:olfactory receptor 142-like n=1 Tax=Archocentrus centrarchus TaxID=63155 RepID=UPI0011E9B561|nr:olfactory receptor 142-like [Archocentrus centrarchus]